MKNLWQNLGEIKELGNKVKELKKTLPESDTESLNAKFIFDDVEEGIFLEVVDIDNQALTLDIHQAEELRDFLNQTIPQQGEKTDGN